MKFPIVLVCLCLGLNSLAASATYNDLGSFAGQTEATSDGFWDTSARSAVAIDREETAVAAYGFDSFWKWSAVSSWAIDVVRSQVGFLLMFR